MSRINDDQRPDSDEDLQKIGSLLNIESRVLESRITKLEEMVERQQETLRRMNILFLLYIMSLAVVVGKIFFDVL